MALSARRQLCSFTCLLSLSFPSTLAASTTTCLTRREHRNLNASVLISLPLRSSFRGVLGVFYSMLRHLGSLSGFWRLEPFDFLYMFSISWRVRPGPASPVARTRRRVRRRPIFHFTIMHCSTDLRLFFPGYGGEGNGSGGWANRRGVLDASPAGSTRGFLALNRRRDTTAPGPPQRQRNWVADIFLCSSRISNPFVEDDGGGFGRRQKMENATFHFNFQSRHDIVICDLGESRQYKCLTTLKTFDNVVIAELSIGGAGCSGVLRP